MVLATQKNEPLPIKYWKLEIGEEHITFRTSREMGPVEVRRRLMEAIDALLPKRLSMDEMLHRAQLSSFDDIKSPIQEA